jgi:DNA ligase 1
MILGYDWFRSNPRGWLMSEKLNGVRCYWDGFRLFTRDNKPIFAPDLFLAHLPSGIGLDGELWHGRDGYRTTMKLFQGTGQSDKPEWASVRFGVFDAPKHGGSIEERADYLRTLPLTGPVFRLEHVRCTSIAHLKRRFLEVFEGGGEGLVLRKAGSLYLHERTTQFLKVKLPWW